MKKCPGGVVYPNYTYPPDPGSRGAPPACHQPPRQTRPLARRTRRPRAGGHHPGTDRMTPHSLPPTTQPSAEQCQVPRTHSVNCHDQQCLYCRYVIECYLCVIRRALNSFTKPSRSIGRLMAHSVGLHFRHFRISVRWGGSEHGSTCPRRWPARHRGLVPPARVGCQGCAHGQHRP